MMKTKKVSMLVLASIMGLGCTACNVGGGGIGGDADDVQIIVQTPNLGYGIDWLKEFNDRFMQKNKDKDYGNGKKGVFVDIDTSASTHSTATMTSEGSHIYIYAGKAKDLAASGNLLALNEIMTEKYDNGKSIEDKCYDNLLDRYKGTDGKYYTIPAYQMYHGISYDVELFDKYGYYFADTKPGIIDEGNCVEFSSALLSNVNYYSDVGFAAGSTGKFYFVDVENSAWKTHKSVGPDGKSGTLDDGLPSTLYELIVLCEKMYNDGVQPIQFAGEYPEYINPLMDSLMFALQGPDKIKAMYDMNGEIEVVTGFSEENLVGDIDYLKKPITKTIEITEESGYYTTWQVERYYAEAFVEILETEVGFFADGSHSTNSVTHLGAQENFIYSGYNKIGQNAKEVAMLVDSSHWWYESEIRGTLDAFYMMNKDCTERKVAFMPLPTNVANRVTGEKTTHTTNGITESVAGNELSPAQTLSSGTGGACTYVNKKVADDASVYSAVKDWIQEFYSYSELSKFTASCGFKMAMEYDLKDEDYNSMTYFERDLWDKMKDAYIYVGEGCATVNGNSTLFALGYKSGFFSCCGRATILQCFRADNPHSSMKGFESQIIEKDRWSYYYKGQYPNDIETVDDTIFVKKYS